MIFFDPTLRADKPIKIGDYLDPYLFNTRKINRYIDPRYPEGMVQDRLCDHIIRLRKMVSQLPLIDIRIRKIDRIILIHDLPETNTGDITVILKSEKNLDSKKNSGYNQLYFFVLNLYKTKSPWIIK